MKNQKYSQPDDQRKRHILQVIVAFINLLKKDIDSDNSKIYFYGRFIFILDILQKIEDGKSTYEDLHF